MKISEDYIIRQIAGEYIVVPTGKAAVKLNGLINLNETGAFLWKLLQEGASKEELLSGLLSEYDADEETAKADLEEFLDRLSAEGILEV